MKRRTRTLKTRPSSPSSVCPACGETAEALTCTSCGTSFGIGGVGGTRDLAARGRDETAEMRDRTAESRDRAAEARDQLADNREQSQPGSDAEGHAGNREDAAYDRRDSADDREESSRDRAGASDDRTESADAANRALETLELMSDAYFTLDREWRFSYLNPQCELILKRRREELVGRSFWEEFPAALGSCFEAEFRWALREQLPVRFEELYEPLGLTLQVRAYPATFGLVVYFTDVTQERVREARLRQSERLETIGRVTASVAHDFNNLLTAIGGFAQLGQARIGDGTATGYFDEIDSASQKARALTRQLLSFARQQALSPAVIYMNDVVDELFALLHQLMPAGIKIQTSSPPSPVPVFVDRSQLEQVLVNLVVNSRDAIEATGSITVSTMNEAPAGLAHDVEVPSGWLQVADTGSGIPEEIQPHIFDPFFSTKPLETGTGLGLATTYGIVTQSGGSVFVDSTVGVGTMMTVALPRTPPSQVAANGSGELQTSALTTVWEESSRVITTNV